MARRRIGRRPRIAKSRDLPIKRLSNPEEDSDAARVVAELGEFLTSHGEKGRYEIKENLTRCGACNGTRFKLTFLRLDPPRFECEECGETYSLSELAKYRIKGED